MSWKIAPLGETALAGFSAATESLQNSIGGGWSISPVNVNIYGFDFVR